MLDAVRELLETMPLVPQSYQKYRPLVIDGLLPRARSASSTP